jgi:hypothetical protein
MKFLQFIEVLLFADTGVLSNVKECTLLIGLIHKTKNNLAFKQRMFTYVKAHKKIPMYIYFIYLGNKKIYCILRHAE